jgi:hypothetical protein
MTTKFILDQFKTLDADVFLDLKSFSMRKTAKQWCKENNVPCASIDKVSTRWQYSYIINMGRNHFLVDDAYVEAKANPVYSAW